MERTIRRAKVFLEYMERFVPAVSLALVAILVLMEAILRYTVRKMPLGLEELAVFFAVWLFFIGAALASKDREQITVDFLEVFHIPELYIKKIKILAGIFSLICLLIFVYFAVEYCIWVNSTRVNISPFGWPLLTAILSMTIGLALISLHELSHLIKEMRNIRS